MPLAPLVDPWQRQQLAVLEDLDVCVLKCFIIVLYSHAHIEQAKFQMCRIKSFYTAFVITL